jgi:radical SAM superfamily enzyme YgiQ (UPF0313 family)
MNILILNLPVHAPSVMPYSLCMMNAVLNSEIDANISVLDLNAKYHKKFFKTFYERLDKDNYFSLLDEFIAKTRSEYPKISKNAIKGEKPDGYKFIIKQILDKKPDYICMSFTYNSQVFFARSIINELKKLNIKVIIGGPADLSKIKKEVVHLQNYKELIDYFVDKGFEKFSKKAILDFSIFDKLDYFTKEIVYPIRTAKSCPYKLCTFCTHHGFSKYDMFDLDFIKETIQHNKMKKICFIDDCFTSDRLLKIAKMLKTLNVKWWCQLRPTKDMIDILPELYDSGLRSVAWGVESGNQRVLDYMVKGTKVDEISNVLKKAKKIGVINQIYVMFGLPTETKDEFMDTINFLENNKENIDLISTSVFGLQKGSLIYDNPKKYGVSNVMTKDRTLLGEKITYETSQGLSNNETKKLKKEYMKKIESIDKIPRIINSCKEQILNF